ncbi:MAG TPA: alpha/beta fold hydrolase [Verrucomicrobiae bacterium]|jgi:phospholipase/carboxylesterase|nr:alpha/beta fold hydrolase [Verrucomicrobiae bacterium]
MLETVLIPAAEPSRRLLVVLHGLGDSPDGYRWLPDAMQLPWLDYLLVRAPDSYYGGFSWYDLYGNSATGILRSRDLLLALLADLTRQDYLPENITLFGFSQGCLMIMELAARFPQRLAGVVGISGYIHEPETLLREAQAAAPSQRILMTHGSQDPLIPLAPVRAQMETLRRAGWQIDWREFNKAHTIAGDEEMEVIRDFVRAGYPA